MKITPVYTERSEPRTFTGRQLAELEHPSMDGIYQNVDNNYVGLVIKQGIGGNMIYVDHAHGVIRAFDVGIWGDSTFRRVENLKEIVIKF